MSDAKTNSGMLQSILSGIVLAALTGVATMQVKNGEKLSDIRAAMMPRDEIELRLHQFALDIRALELAQQIDKRSAEARSQATDISIIRLQNQMEQTVRTRQ